VRGRFSTRKWGMGLSIMYNRYLWMIHLEKSNQISYEFHIVRKT
jgi:hypothetical protein